MANACALKTARQPQKLSRTAPEIRSLTLAGLGVSRPPARQTGTNAIIAWK